MLAPNEYQEEVEHEAKAKPGLVFDLRDRSGFAHHQDRPSENALSLAQLEFMARLTGALYPAASHPSSGWGGDTNPWDAWVYATMIFVPSEIPTPMFLPTPYIAAIPV